jgi:Zn finger protein HypA/HybF involved in hydrogenase expression
MSTHLDGNVLAGALGEVFAIDVTAAVGQCVSCGTSGAIAGTRVYTSAPGLVARCPACGEVVLRIVRGPDRAWLDLRGLTCLELSVPTS